MYKTEGDNERRLKAMRNLKVPIVKKYNEREVNYIGMNYINFCLMNFALSLFAIERFKN